MEIVKKKHLKNENVIKFTTLNYLRPHKSKFDFFSSDTMTILKLGRELTKKFQQEKLTPEILLLTLFNSESDLTDILRKYNISFAKIKRYIIYGHQLTDDILQEKFKQRQTKFGKLSFQSREYYTNHF